MLGESPPHSTSNMLLVLNHELGANFDPALFEHRAFYERVNHRIEMHLVSTLEHEVRIPGIGLVPFAEGESIRTEISCKHDRASVAELFWSGGASDRDLETGSGVTSLPSSSGSTA